MAICSMFKERMLPANQLGAPFFPDLTDLVGGFLHILAITVLAMIRILTANIYAFNQLNKESRSKELDTNTRSRKTTTKLMEKRGSRTTVLQLHNKNQCAYICICIP